MQLSSLDINRLGNVAQLSLRAAVSCMTTENNFSNVRTFTWKDESNVRVHSYHFHEVCVHQYHRSNENELHTSMSKQNYISVVLI